LYGFTGSISRFWTLSSRSLNTNTSPGSVFIARHGEREDEIDPTWRDTHAAFFTDPPLSAKGKRQAALLGQHMKGHRISHIFASPMLRTCQTAYQVALALDMPIKLEWGLKERSTVAFPEDALDGPCAQRGVGGFLSRHGLEPPPTTLAAAAAGPLYVLTRPDFLFSECPTIDATYESHMNLRQVASESREHAVSRTEYIFRRLHSKFPGNILIVTHSDIAKYAVERILPAAAGKKIPHCSLSKFARADTDLGAAYTAEWLWEDEFLRAA